jgi:hypothetical protein
MKTTVLKYLLLDADVIIHLFEIGLWGAFINRFDISVSSTVVNEVTHYHDKNGVQVPINLRDEEITILSLSAEKSYGTVYSIIDRNSGPDLHMGEIESISLLMEEENEKLVLCTGDGGAIIALCLLGLKERTISLEEALKQGGMKRKVKPHFTIKRMRDWKNRGEDNLIRRVGLLK